jgi:hypothetical protein
MAVSTSVITSSAGTNDTNPIWSGLLYQQVAATVINATLPMQELYKLNAGTEHPLVLASGEGFRLLSLTAMGAAGVGNLYFVIDYSELPTL